MVFSGMYKQLQSKQNSVFTPHWVKWWKDCYVRLPLLLLWMYKLDMFLQGYGDLMHYVSPKY